MTLSPQEQEVQTRDLFELYDTDPEETEQWTKLGNTKEFKWTSEIS